MSESLCSVLAFVNISYFLIPQSAFMLTIQFHSTGRLIPKVLNQFRTARR